MELKEPKPIHDHILILHLAGRTNIEIGEILNIHPQTAMNVIRSDWGSKRVEMLRDQVKGNLLGSIENQLVELAHKSIDNIRRTVEAPISVLHTMKKHQDRLGMELLQGVGFLKNVERDDDGKVGFGEAAADRLAKAIERSNAIRARKENEVEVADAVVVNSETRAAS